MRGQSARWWTGAGLVLVVAFAALVADAVVVGEVPVHGDTAFNLMAARDCLEGDHCFLSGGPFRRASRAGPPHGTLFLYYLVALDAPDTSTGALPASVFALFAAALGLFYLLAARLFGVVPALAGALVFVVLHGATYGAFSLIGGPNVGNPSLLPLPALLFVACVAGYLVERRFRWLLAGTVAFAIAVQVHLSFAVHLVTVVGLVVAMPAQRRVPFLAAFVLIVVAAVQVVSPGVLADFALPRLGRDVLFAGEAATLDSGANIAVIAVFLVAGAAAWALHVPRAGGGRGPGRVVRFLLATHLPLLVGLLFVWSLTDYYVASLAPGLALLAAGLVEGLVRGAARALGADGAARPAGSRAVRGRVVRAVALAVVVAAGALWTADLRSGPLAGAGRALVHSRLAADPDALTRLAGTPSTSHDEARAMGRFLDRQLGWDYATAFRRVRATRSAPVHIVLAGIAAAMPVAPSAPPVAPSSPPRGGEEDIAFLLSRCAPSPSDPPNVHAVPDAGRVPLVALTFHPWLRWERIAVCGWEPTEGPPCAWHEVPYDHTALSSLHHEGRPYAALRRDPGFLRRGSGLKRGAAVLWRVPLRAPAGAPPHAIHLPLVRGPDPFCSGAIVAVDGVPFEGPLPARTVTIPTLSAPREGHLVMEWRHEFGPCDPSADSVVPPAIVELDPPARAWYERCVDALSATPYIPPLAAALPEPAALFAAEGRQPDPCPDGVCEGPGLRREPSVPLVYVWGVLLLVVAGLGATTALVVGFGLGDASSAAEREAEPPRGEEPAA